MLDPRLYRGLPVRWGGGIHKLTAAARPFFARLFELMEARGHEPRSHYPHRDVSGDGLPDALDIIDNRWELNAWQTPTDETIAFYRDLGILAGALGLTWGGKWAKYHGDDSAWAQRWRAVTGYGDMLHVEWRLAAGTTVPEVDLAALFPESSLVAPHPPISPRP